MADWLGGGPGLDCPSLLLSISGLILQEAYSHQSTAGAPGHKGCSGLCLCPIGQSGSCGRGQRPGMEEQAPSGWEAAVTRPRGVHPGSRGGHETWREGWREDHLKASAGEEVGPSLSCLHQTKSEQRAGAPSGWFGASGWRPALAVSSPACPAPAESEALAWGARWWAREATSREPCPRLSWGVSLGTELSELSRTCRAAAWCEAAGAQSTRAAARGEGGSVSRRGRLESLVCGEGRLRAEPALALDGPGCPGGKW